MAPTNVIASKTEITIGWVAPDNRGSDLTGFEILWNGGSGDTYTVKHTLTDPALTQVATTGLTEGTYYKFKVIAINSVGSSLASPEVEIKSAVVPDAPINLTLVS